MEVAPYLEGKGNPPLVMNARLQRFVAAAAYLVTDARPNPLFVEQKDLRPQPSDRGSYLLCQDLTRDIQQCLRKIPSSVNRYLVILRLHS